MNSTLTAESYFGNNIPMSFLFLIGPIFLISYWSLLFSIVDSAMSAVNMGYHLPQP